MTYDTLKGDCLMGLSILCMLSRPFPPFRFFSTVLPSALCSISWLNMSMVFFSCLPPSYSTGLSWLTQILFLKNASLRLFVIKARSALFLTSPSLKSDSSLVRSWMMSVPELTICLIFLKFSLTFWPDPVMVTERTLDSYWTPQAFSTVSVWAGFACNLCNEFTLCWGTFLALWNRR